MSVKQYACVALALLSLTSAIGGENAPQVEDCQVNWLLPYIQLRGTSLANLNTMLPNAVILPADTEGPDFTFSVRIVIPGLEPADAVVTGHARDNLIDTVFLQLDTLDPDAVGHALVKQCGEGFPSLACGGTGSYNGHIWKVFDSDVSFFFQSPSIIEIREFRP